MNALLLLVAIALAQDPPPSVGEADLPAAPTPVAAPGSTAPPPPADAPIEPPAAEPVAEPVGAPPATSAPLPAPTPPTLPTPVPAPAPDPEPQPTASPTAEPVPATAPPPVEPTTGWPVYPPAPTAEPRPPQLLQPVFSLDLADRILPWLPLRGFRYAVLLLGITLLAALLASLAGRLRGHLSLRGLLPRGVSALQVALRVVVVFTALGVIAALLPRSIAPALPLVVLAVAVAVGWSARDLLPDLVAGVALGLERRIRPGQWIAGDDFAGVVEAIGARALWLRDVKGRLVQVPNRRLMLRPITSDTDRWPLVEVVLDVPGRAPAAEVRERLLETVLLSPWLAPGTEPVLVRDAAAARRWRVRARVLEGRFADRFEGALRERIEDDPAATSAEGAPPHPPR